MTTALDVWDCGFSDTDLFCRKVGFETQTLDELVERSLNGSPVSLESEELTALSSADSPSMSENVQVVACDGAAAAPVRRIAPKILKKKSSLNARRDNSLKNLKKVTFEVEKLVADEAYSGADQQDARARMAVRLGAKPLSNDCVNYKQLKIARAEAKIEATGDASGLLDMKRKLSQRTKKSPKKIKA